ncbi:MAG TPA: efflux RND transporter periplasmic adaptor subunit [Gemmatimonadales bacterium]|jgi:HlyD family secretion protein|nr:efflux RND transporter periplasmic adaptor subunit [Gemmatimonadales bacterium]
MTRRALVVAATTVPLLVGACQKAQTAPLYEKVPVQRRDVVVTATGLGVIQPILKFSVKSKAWGQILAMPVQTGDDVKKGQLLAKIDPRLPQNNLSQAQATVEKARAQLENATAQLKRSEALFQSQAIAETDYDFAKLANATAHSALVTAQANLQTAQDAMEDTQVRAPITGTVLELDATVGTVISSPTLGGGSVILKMANLDTVRDSSLALETDIGRVQPGMAVTITVDAFPNTAFDGTVLKIEPQAQVSQNVTKFPVLVNIPNPGHRLKPGMNTQVQIHTGSRAGVLAIPNAALRTAKDVGSAASLLGLDPQAVQQQLAATAAADSSARPSGDTAAAGKRVTFTTPNGREIPLPPGVTAEQVQAAFARMRGGGQPTAADRALLAQLFGRSQKGSAGGPTRGGGANNYIVFALRSGTIVPVPIKTGLSDQDHIEVRSGLTDRDTVLVLPSASLVQAQQQFRQRFQNVTGGGLPGLRQQQPQSTTRRVVTP